MQATILRLEHNETETVGVLLIEGEMCCCTLELPWRSNTPTISCIPEGRYVVERYDSPKYGRLMWGVQGAPGRQGIILGEVGNTHGDTQGCILFGMYSGYLQKGGPRAVMNSQRTCAAFEARTHNIERIDLQIIGVRT